MILKVVMFFGVLFFNLIDSLFAFFSHMQKASTLLWRTFVRIPQLFKNPNLTLHQMYIIGIESLPLVAVTSIFVGGEAVIQANFQFAGMVPMKYLGFAVSKSLITELCPVLTSFVVSSRISTAIAAEIGSMKSSEQLDAMQCLSLDSIRYLIVPKVVAGIIMIPVLVIISELIAFIGSALTAVFFIDITMHLYLTGLQLFFSAADMIIGITKTTVFGAIITLTGSYFGFQALKGAEGIGEATTKATMFSSVLILIFDFLIAFVLFKPMV